MKKFLRIKFRKPKVKLPKALKRKEAPEKRLHDAFANVPNITNETLAEHREEVLSSARKYIYPLQHSRKRIIFISSSIFIGAVLLFFIYTGLALYRFQSTSSFIYGVTRVIPFPVAKVGNRWVSYQSYLFELRRYMHYYQTQQQVNFSTTTGKKQLDTYKQQAMNTVINNTYVKELAAKYHVGVSERAVNNEIALVRSQNRLGSSQQELNAVLSDFWGWNEADFARELRHQLLSQAVVYKLDTAARNRAQEALIKLQQGANFATLAAQVSEDATTKANGGQFPSLVTKDDPNISPQIVKAIYALKPGQISGIVDSGYTLEIVKVLQIESDGVQAAHISFNLNPISHYIKPLETKQKPYFFIHI